MNAAESQALALVEALKTHCEKNRLPLLVLVGLVESNSMARAFDEGKSPMTREIFKQTAHELLSPRQN